MTLPAILILAAGGSTRMAPRDKLTEMVGGQPLLRRQALQALATDAPVLVVLRPDRPERKAVLQGLAVRIVTAQDADLGMAASLKAGIAALGPDTPGALVLPADMPGIDTEDLCRFLTQFAETPARILRGATRNGQEGHPALFPADLFPALLGLSGDEGARSVLRDNRQRVDLITLPGDHAILDLDTPEDWAAFRALGGQ